MAASSLNQLIAIRFTVSDTNTVNLNLIPLLVSLIMPPSNIELEAAKFADFFLFLANHNLTHLHQTFVDAKLTEVELLFDVTDEDLKELSIPIGDRKRLARALFSAFPDEPEIALSCARSRSVSRERAESLSLSVSRNLSRVGSKDSGYHERVGCAEVGMEGSGPGEGVRGRTLTKDSGGSTVASGPGDECGYGKPKKKLTNILDSDCGANAGIIGRSSSSGEETGVSEDPDIVDKGPCNANAKTATPTKKLNKAYNRYVAPGSPGPPGSTSDNVLDEKPGLKPKPKPKLRRQNAHEDITQINNLSTTAALKRKETAQKIGGTTIILETLLIAGKMTKWWTQLIVYLPGFIASFYAVQWRERIDVWAAARGLKVREKRQKTQCQPGELEDSGSASAGGSEVDSFEDEPVRQDKIWNEMLKKSGCDVEFYDLGKLDYSETVVQPGFEESGSNDGPTNPDIDVSDIKKSSDAEARQKLRLAAAFLVLKTFLITNFEFLIILAIGSIATISRDDKEVTFDTVINYLFGTSEGNTESDTDSGTATAFRILAIVFLSVSVLTGVLFVYTVYAEFRNGLLQKAKGDRLGAVKLRKLRILSTDPEKDTRLPDLTDLENNPISVQRLSVKTEDWYSEDQGGALRSLASELGPCGAVIKLIKFGA